MKQQQGLAGARNLDMHVQPVDPQGPLLDVGIYSHGMALAPGLSRPDAAVRSGQQAANLWSKAPVWATCI